MFNNSSAKEPPPDPFQTEDPFKSFSGLNTFLYLIVSALYTCHIEKSVICAGLYSPCCGLKEIKDGFDRLFLVAEDDWCIKPLCSHFSPHLDPFGGDPFRESDPFKGTSSEDFFKRTDKADLFGSSDPFGRKPTPPAKVLITSAIYHENVLFYAVWLEGPIPIHILWPYPYFWSAAYSVVALWSWATMVRAPYLNPGNGTLLMYHCSSTADDVTYVAHGKVSASGVSA